MRVWETIGLGAFRWLRELTAREPLTRMARPGIDSDGPCAQGTDRTGRPGEPTAWEPGVLTTRGWGMPISLVGDRTCCGRCDDGNPLSDADNPKSDADAAEGRRPD